MESATAAAQPEPDQLPVSSTAVPSPETTSIIAEALDTLRASSSSLSASHHDEQETQLDVATDAAHAHAHALAHALPAATSAVPSPAASTPPMSAASSFATSAGTNAVLHVLIPIVSERTTDTFAEVELRASFMTCGECV